MPRCLGIKVHLQHFSWWRSRSQAFLLERSQTESHFHEPLQLGEMGGPGPVAGAAAGSRPTYLKWSIDSLSAVAGARVCNVNWNLTKLTSCWPTLWGNAAEHNRSGPCSCAPPDTRSALSRRTSWLLPWPSRKGMERSGADDNREEGKINK